MRASEWTPVALCYYARGEVYFAKGQYESAVGDFSKGLQLAPNVQGLSKRAEAYEHLGKREKALADFKAVLSIAPTFEDALEGVKRLGFVKN
jgi:tetratricopeptide (TPR) repeat protein